jgi:hypothetical protein
MHRLKYPPRHRRVRRVVAEFVLSGRAACSRCGELIVPGEPWDLGHRDGTLELAGPEHRRCNRSAGARSVRRRVSLCL